ncbi:hypothetical protein V3C99_003416 [Haemonchus contortus]|nr:viral A-type inclusion protein [Haemonchus contortus]
MEFNCRDEQSVNITSEMSSFEDEEREAGGASTTTLTQDVSVNNLAVGEVRTPSALNPPNLRRSEPATGRLSLSQPELSINYTPPTKVARLNMSTGNICSPSGKPPRPNKKSLSRTLEENKLLREEIAVLKSKLEFEQYKVAELESLQPREVQDILEEYYSLQMSKFDMDVAESGGDAVVAEVPISPERTQQKVGPSNATNLSVMNASLMDLMSRSMNTSKDIVTFKTKLVSLRDVMHQMFEILKSSGVLFEDVLELLGSGTEEMRDLADRIRAMKFEWNTAIEGKRVVMDAIEETVVSVNRMQTELSAWEQSLNETSFRLDISMAQTTTECYSVQTGRADEGGDSSLYQKSLEEQRKQISLKTEEVDHMRSIVDENASLKEVIAERESNLDVLRAALDEEQERRQEEHENLKKDLAKAQSTSSALRRDLERIRNELNTKDEKNRCLQDQLRCVEENNYRMGEVVSSFASDENKGARSTNANPLTAVVGVRTTALI